MLSEKQLKFLELNKEWLESIPSTRRFYDKALDQGLTRREAIELLFYYAESSKCFTLKVVQELEPASLGEVVTVTLEGKIDPRDKLFVTKLRYDSSEVVRGDQILKDLGEILKVSYDIDLSRLKGITGLIGTTRY